MTAMVYKWTKGSKFTTEVSAQVAGEELERIRKLKGTILTEDVLQENSEPDAPLYPICEWDNEVAGHKYRLEQIAHVIRSVVIVNVEQPETAPIRAFVSIKNADNDSSYTHINVAMADPDLREQVLKRAWSELEGWRKRYQDLVEFSEIFTAIEVAKAA